MPLGASPAEVEHARAFLRKWSLGRYLASYKASAHTMDKDVLVLSAHNTIRDAMAMLARRGVLSAPVLDEKRAVFLGFCSLGDIVAAFLRSDSAELLLVRHQIGPEPGAPGDAAAHAPPTPAERAGGGGGGAQPIQFAELKVEALMPGADGHLLFNSADPQYAALSLLDVVEGAFLHAGAPNWPTCHRVAVCEALAGVLAVSAVVSQTDMVRFLLEHMPKGALGPLASRSLEDLGLVIDPETMQPRGVECVDGGTPALDAFGALLTRGVSALGVLNENGQLIANLSLSASDLRVVLPDRFGVLAQPVHRFLALECAGGLGVTRGTGGVRKTGGVITVRADATLEDAMRAIVAHNVHHVFVVSDAQAPLAVVSTTDVLRLIVPT